MRPVDGPVPGLSGCRVIVTGGTRGIGAGIARGFLRSGARVLVCGRNDPADRAALPAAPPAEGGRSAEFARADVRDPDQAARLIATAAGLFGGVDVVISNAGGAPPAPAAIASPRLHARVIELNLIAPLHVAQAANEVMQSQPAGGSIIMIGSVSGTRPSPGTAAYGAAKAGLHHLVTSLAIEWAPKVRVNTVVPGFVATESAAAHYGDADGVAVVAATVPLRRMATPDDVAEACLFLASPRAAYVSGASLTLHGGGEPPAFLSARQLLPERQTAGAAVLSERGHLGPVTHRQPRSVWVVVYLGVMTWRAVEFAVIGQQGQAEGLGQRHVHGVIGGEVVPEFEHAGLQGLHGMPHDPQARVVGQHLARPGGRDPLRRAGDRQAAHDA
jgi:NAD(P)-dependent dehydrogenase (short-subunit alcohol dehydrogenase family)